MSLKDRFSKLVRTIGDKPTASKEQFGSVDYTIPSIAKLIEKRSEPWVYYGENNLYPEQVKDLRSGSSIHNSIIKTKAKMTAGDGFFLNDAVDIASSKIIYQSLPNKADFDMMINNPLDKDNLQMVINKCAEDLQEQGQACYEVIFNNDFSKIVRHKYVDVSRIRSGKFCEGEIESYFYARDWSKAKQKGYEPVEIQAFDPDDKENYNQLVFIKLGNNDYYGELPYKGCLTWIQTDFKMGLFHLSNIDNGMNPGMHFKFYKLPKTEDDKAEILRQLKKTYQGALNTNKFVATFSDGKELATDVTPIQTSNLDKQLLLLAELCDKKILTGHQLTSPLLAGVSVSGQLGGNIELKTAYQIFDKMTIEADRNFLMNSFQKSFDYNKLGVKVNINPFNPFI